MKVEKKRSYIQKGPEDHNNFAFVILLYHYDRISSHLIW